MNLSRRHFLESLAIALGGVACGWRSPRIADDSDLQRAIELLQGHPSFDLHCHPGRLHTGGSSAYGGDHLIARTVREMQVGGLWGGFFALVADSTILVRRRDGIGVSRAFEPGEAWELYQQQLAALKQLLAVVPAAQANRAQDLGLIHEQGEVAAFIACEGAHCLEGRPERVEQMYEDGVRTLQLVHYAPDVVGDLQTEEPVYHGLSSVGREVIREMDRLGMVIDVAHASFKTVLDVAEVSENPIILSHSQLRSADKRHPRLLEPAHAEAVAETGGVIGMWPSGFGNDDLADFVDNTLRLVDLVGVRHVGLGTDMDGNYKPVFDSYRQLPDWTAALLARGLTEAEAGQLIGGNAMRVLSHIL